MNNQSDHFINAVKAHFAPSPDNAQREFWMDYVLKTNERGQLTVETLKKFTDSLQSKRHLDIGSAYGGTCIAAALAGAESLGIEINPQLIQLGEENKLDYPGVNVQFVQLDILDWEQARALGKFDIITCDNVIEHVANPERLIAYMRLLLAEGGFAYVTIPNAFSVGQVRKDCHYGLFGISLLDPWDGALYLKQVVPYLIYDVSIYYPFDMYASLFKKYGLKVKLLNPLPEEEKEIHELEIEADNLKEETISRLAAGSFPPEIAGKMEKTLDVYFEQLKTSFFYYHNLPKGDEKQDLIMRLARDNRIELWYLVATPDRGNFFDFAAFFDSLYPRLRKAIKRTMKKVWNR